MASRSTRSSKGEADSPRTTTRRLSSQSPGIRRHSTNSPSSLGRIPLKREPVATRKRSSLTNTKQGDSEGTGGAALVGAGFRRHSHFTVEHGDEESDSSQHSFGVHSHSSATGKKQRTLIKGPSGEVEGKDFYCWQCHKEDPVVPCDLCPRVFHAKCLGIEAIPDTDWACPECEKVMKAECTDTQSRAMSMLTLDQFCICLKYVVQRMKSQTLEVFHKPVDSHVVTNYDDFIVNPMDLSTLDKNIKRKLYGSTQAFLADAKWLLHNCIIFNGATNKLTSGAKMIMKICKHETSEIEVCPDCYLNSCLKRNDNWFCEPCRQPHTLVWAKLKGYPYWPAKALRVVNGQVDVRFFGEHDRAWVAISQVYMLSKEIPAGSKKGKAGFEASMEELDLHISRIKEKFGSFNYFPTRTLYSSVDTSEPGKPDAGTAVKSESPGSHPAVSPVTQTRVPKSKSADSPTARIRVKETPKSPKSSLHKTASAVRNKYNSIITTRRAAAAVSMDTPDKDDEEVVQNDEEESLAASPDLKVTKALNTKDISKRVISSAQDTYSRTVVHVNSDKGEILKKTNSPSDNDSETKPDDNDQDKSSSPDSSSQHSGVFTISEDALDVADTTIRLSMPLLSTKFNIPKPRLPNKDILDKLESVVKDNDDNNDEEEEMEEADIKDTTDNPISPEELKSDTNRSDGEEKCEVQTHDSDENTPEKKGESVVDDTVAMETEDVARPAPPLLTKKDNLFLESLVKTCKEKLRAKSMKSRRVEDDESESSSSSESSDSSDSDDSISGDNATSDKEKGKQSPAVSAEEKHQSEEDHEQAQEKVKDLSDDISPAENKDTSVDTMTAASVDTKSTLEESTEGVLDLSMEEASSDKDTEGRINGEDSRISSSAAPEKTSDMDADEDDSESQLVIDMPGEGKATPSTFSRRGENAKSPCAKSPKATTRSMSSPRSKSAKRAHDERDDAGEAAPLKRSRNMSSGSDRSLSTEKSRRTPGSSMSPRGSASPRGGTSPRGHTSPRASTSPRGSDASPKLKEVVIEGRSTGPHIEKYVKRAVSSLSGVFEEMCKDIIESQTENMLAQKLSQEIENMKWKHRQEMAELKHNTELNIREMKTFWKASMDTMRRQLLAKKKKVPTATLR